MVSESLPGAISQQFVPCADGKSRGAACEVQFNTPSIANLIWDERAFRIPSIMPTLRNHGT